MTHSEFDPHCDMHECVRCKYINLAFQESPPRVDRKRDDTDVLATHARELLAPPRAKVELSQERMRAALFPKLVAAELVGLRTQIDNLRGQLVIARDLAREHRQQLERLRDHLIDRELDEAELLLAHALSEVSVDDALAGAALVDVSLARAREAVARA